MDSEQDTFSAQLTMFAVIRSGRWIQREVGTVLPGTGSSISRGRKGGALMHG